jgi:hypothetical protein
MHSCFKSRGHSWPRRPLTLHVNRVCDVIDLRGRSQGAGLNSAGASLWSAISELCRASASERAQVPYVEIGVGLLLLASKSGVYATT